MRVLPVVSLLTLLLGCPGPPSNTHDTTPISNNALLTPTQILVRPGAPAQDLKAQVIQKPAGGAYAISLWQDGGTFRWEILNAPVGVDGGRFQLLDSGSIREALVAGLITQTPESLLQSFVPPNSLPPGTIRLELKLRVTITPPNPSSNGGIAQAEIPLVIDVNAPASAPSQLGAIGVSTASAVPGET